MIATGVVLVHTLQSHFATSADRLAAIGDVFGGGIFLFALIAAVVAVLAYADSSRRPQLSTSCEFLSPADGTPLEGRLPREQPCTRTFRGYLPPSAGAAADLVPLAPVKLRLRVENHGQVVARNVTVVLYLEGIFFDTPLDMESPPKWKLAGLNDKGWQVQWEAGTDVAYPGDVPRTPSIDLVGMWAVPEIRHTPWGSVVTLADDLKQPETQALKVDSAPLPAVPTPA